MAHLVSRGDVRRSIRDGQHLWYVHHLPTVHHNKTPANVTVAERTARALQLGVLVGFAVVAPTFDPSDQKAQTMKTMCALRFHCHGLKYS